MSASKKVRIGLVGAGNIANSHMKQFSQLTEECEITAVSDVHLPLAKERAQTFEIPQVFDQSEDLLQSDDVDAVIIAVPNKYHAPLAVQALAAGKHVLLEKPMGIDADSAKEIVKAQQQSDKIIMIAHQMRWNWVPMQVKKQIERGELGKIYNAKAGLFRRKGIPGWGSWFTRKEQSGGGPLIDIGVHMLDLALHLMGNPKPISVYGSTYAEFGPKKKGVGSWGTPNWSGHYDVEDLATALIKMEDGSTLSLEVSWAVHMDTNSKPFIHLMGSEGGASLQGNDGKFLTEKFDQAIATELKVPNSDEGARIRMSRHFLECIREGKQPLTNAMSGLANNLILDAIYESSRTGNEIKLDWNIN